MQEVPQWDFVDGLVLACIFFSIMGAWYWSMMRVRIQTLEQHLRFIYEVTKAPISPTENMLARTLFEAHYRAFTALDMEGELIRPTWATVGDDSMSDEHGRHGGYQVVHRENEDGEEPCCL